ncbi:hypothetical protein [Cognatishimia sp.]|uniref:hypothetical protein n=1 Tax=Cognatishimia sp. TaxID=2211648 RepID=UPI0035123496|nr:hypothetical protein [Cognatishimia sp.]
MQFNSGDKYLVSCDNWFIGKDGNQYQAVWGPVKIVVTEEMLGIKTNHRSTNWYAIVGYPDDHVIVAGCQIHYATKLEDPTNLEESKADSWGTYEGKPFHEKQAFPAGIYVTKDG